jgi:rubredoxin
MRRHRHTIKINLPGGIIAAGDLYALMTAAEKIKLEQVQLGNRQQLYCSVPAEQLKIFQKELDQLNLFYETDKISYPNILSSYVAEDVFQSSHWLAESVYKDILSSFDYRPKVKISLVDAQQTFTPFYSGNFNFISSPVNNYWYLYIRFPKTPVIYSWKGLIYSGDIARISRVLEGLIFAHKELFYEQPAVSGDALYNMVQNKEHFFAQPVGSELVTPTFALPYYEGFNRYGDKSWLGIYRRDEYFPVAFLKEVALICLQTKIGQLYTTAWKSLIIKGIQQTDRRQWDYVLGKYRINVRHAANELNWQVEDMDEEALNLKQYLIRQFDKDDVRTFGLCFAIKTKPHSNVFGAIVIRKQHNEAKNKHKSLDRYDILYCNDFNPNNKEYILFRKGVEKENLGTYLISLCKYYYELQSEDSSIMHNVYRQEEETKKQAAVPVVSTPAIYQCSHCLTVYDPQYGDEANGIAAGTVFDQLPGSYQCPVCEADKQDFQPVMHPEIFAVDGFLVP